MITEYIYIDVIAPSFIFGPVAMGCWRYRWLPGPAKWLLFYLFVEAVVSIVSTVLAQMQKSNLPLYHLATLVETMLLLHFFSLILQDRRWVTACRILLWVFPVLAVLNTIFIQPLNVFNSYALSGQSLLVINCCFVYWSQHQNEEERTWGSLPMNWIVSGLLLYFSSAFILFTFSNFIIPLLSQPALLVLWNLHATLALMMYLLMAIGFSKYSANGR